MKSIKITLFLIAGLTALQPNILTISVPLELACEHHQEKTSWLSRNKGKIAISILLAGVYVYTKYAFDKDSVTAVINATRRGPQVPTAQLPASVAALLTVIQDPKKINVAAKKFEATAEVAIPRLEKQLEGASVQLQAEILKDTMIHCKKMGEIIGREALGEGQRMRRGLLWLEKRFDFTCHAVKKAFTKDD